MTLGMAHPLVANPMLKLRVADVECSELSMVQLGLITLGDNVDARRIQRNPISIRHEASDVWPQTHPDLVRH